MYNNVSVELKYGYGNSETYQFTSLLFYLWNLNIIDINFIINLIENYTFYGGEVPLTPITASELIHTSDPQTVALVSSEILNHSSIVGYELYASSAGIIRISVINYKKF